MAAPTAPAPDAVEGAEAAPPGGGKKLTIIGAVVGLVLGGLVGAFVIAPRLDATAHEPAVVEAESHDETKVAPTAVHDVENLVINPANTNGARFLLITTSIVVKDAVALEEVAARDAEVRDRIVDFLGSKSVEELGDPTRREALRTDLAAAIGGLFQEGVVKRVLLPQFVIQ